MAAGGNVGQAPNMSGFATLSWKEHKALAVHQAAEEAARQTRALSNDCHLVSLSEIIEASPGQVRLKAFSPEEDEDDRGLVESIRAIGMIEPVVLVELKSGAGYGIQAGHRRVAAIRYLGKSKIQAIVVPEDTTGLNSVTVAENVRKDLVPLEWLRAVEWLRGHGCSKEAIAQQTGLTLRHINRLFELGNLSAQARAIFDQNAVGLMSAVAVSKAPLPFQAEIMRLVVEQDFGERQAGELSGAVATRLTEGGLEAVDMRQIAIDLGLLAAKDAAPAAEGQTLDGGSVNASGAGQGGAPPARRGRPMRKAKALTDKAARDELLGYFPGLSPTEVTALAGETVKRHLQEKVVRLAGMCVASGRLKPVEAVQAALRIERLPMASRWLSVLETAAEVRGHLDSGGDPGLNEPFIAFGAQQFVELVKQTAQARKKK